MKKFITLILFLGLSLTSKAQIAQSFYNTGNSSTTKKYVGVSWGDYIPTKEMTLILFVIDSKETYVKEQLREMVLVYEANS
tara:strand:+ start:148 stop:390 length:243 start_codon:yes stop_codon:yes gene_type:complete